MPVVMASFVPITPRLDPRISLPKWRGAFRKAAWNTAAVVARDLRAPVLHWKIVPKFTREVIETPFVIGVKVTTDNDLYRYFNYGTKDHLVRARNKKVMHWIASNGEEYFRKGPVMSPGIVARQWTKKVAERHRRTLENEVITQINKLILHP